MIRGIFDITPTKIDKYTPGTNIRIINYNKFNLINPKYCFLFAWNHFEEILKKEKNNKIKWISHINKNHFKTVPKLNTIPLPIKDLDYSSDAIASIDASLRMDRCILVY
jgi:hypothetical protein